MPKSGSGVPPVPLKVSFAAVGRPVVLSVTAKETVPVSESTMSGMVVGPPKIVPGSTTSGPALAVPRLSAFTLSVYSLGVVSGLASGWSFTVKVPSAAVTVWLTGSGSIPLARFTPSGLPSRFSSSTETRGDRSGAPGTVLSTKTCARGTPWPLPSTTLPVNVARRSAPKTGA